MKLMHPLLTCPIELGQGWVPVLAVESPQLFRQWVFEWSGQSQGEAGTWVLSHQDEVLDCGQHLLMIDQYVHLSLEDRKLLNRFQALVQSVLWEELEEESMALQQHIQSYLSRLTTQIPVPVGYGEGDAVWPLLKTMKFQPVLDGVSPLERLTQYLEQFYQMALYEQWNLLVVEPYQSPPLSQERWHVIDGDFCELRVDSLGEIL